MPNINYETAFDKYFLSRYNSNDMEIYGKKQIDIREDNKSAVIDILLQQESTMLQMSEQLKLSHTALAKVINELRQKNVVQLTEVRECGAGRPPKVYGVNGNCAITCAVILRQDRIYVYYVDMRGFQINKMDCGNNFSSLGDVLDYAAAQVKSLKQHPRLSDKILKNIYVGIPSADFYGETFASLQQAVFEKFNCCFPQVRTVVKRNVDYEIIAESKYGLLNRGVKNAVLINMDDYVCASFILGGNVYCGDNGMQGYDPFGTFKGFNHLFDGDSDLAAKYRDGDCDAVNKVHSATVDEIKRVGEVLRFLDINEIVLGGAVMTLGERYTEFCRRSFGDDKCVRYSTMGKDVPAALSGAVWQATYSTLQEVMIRQ